MTNQIPPALGAWCMMGIVAASMSTSDGAILAMGTVFSHNVVRQFDAMYPSLITPDNLLTSARISTLPFTIIAAILAAFYQQTGYLLIVAFDIVFACMITPLFGCFYAKNPSPRAALCSILTGIILRVTLEFVLPKDGLLVLPLDFPEFDNYGPAASTLLPTFVDGPAGSVWDPSIEPCEQEKYSDYTGVDSLAAFGASMLVFIIIQFVEHKIGRPIFYFPGDVGYEKDLGDDKANQSHGDVDKSVARTIDIDQSMKPAIVDFNKEEEVA
jgi:Na+/proline symporter